MSPTSTAQTSEFLFSATGHTAAILQHAFLHDNQQPALIISDYRCELATILTGAYQQNLPQAAVLHFDQLAPQQVLDHILALPAGALVVLIQSTHFRLEAYRLRVELFKRGLKIIEHPHLERMLPDEISAYIDSLAYDPDYYRNTGKGLKQLIDRANQGIIVSGDGAQLVFSDGFEPARLNVGDYSGMQNTGGQFPIGEVFTEACDLEKVSGCVRIFVFGDTSFRINEPETPITLIVEAGKVVTTENSTPEFDTVLENIRRDEGGIVWVRELGFGLNRAFTASRRVRDIGTYERMCGIHLSLGAKHGSYGKPHIKRGEGRYHIDVFAITEQVWLDQHNVFQDGKWQLPSEASLSELAVPAER
ncbi:hypothetical protein [Undibacterium luofuense]|uniref:Uncharacterized protein n=1 Tax=Undibacterium luofuense TaxID=2828733 RepID=A0A941DJK9_9BURK|nr:hypothetical protein [Undibacterium luofuense]MBR7781229.1 hypothetical protein [Undibacterium luofuense]